MTELKKRHLALPEDVWRQVKSRAAIEGLTIADYIIKLVRTEMVTPMYRRHDFTDDQPEIRPRPYQDLTKEAYEVKVEPGGAARSTSTPDVAIDRFGHASPAPKKSK